MAIALIYSCSKKVTPDKNIEDRIITEISPTKDDSVTASVRTLCIHGFMHCTNIMDGYYQQKFDQKTLEYMNQNCEGYSKFSDILKDSNADLISYKYTPWELCIKKLQWPVDSVIKYLGTPYEMIAHYDPDNPDIQTGTHLYYCDKTGNDIDCLKAKRHSMGRAVFVPKWK